MKNCPFCAEAIQDDATVCRFCNRNVNSGAGMRRKIIILIIAIIGFFGLCVLLSIKGDALSRSSRVFRPSSNERPQRDAVFLIKATTLDFDQSTTIGKAFDHYQYFESVTWRQLQTENGRTIVQAVGTIDLDRLSEAEIDAAADAYWQGYGVLDQKRWDESNAILGAMSFTDATKHNVKDIKGVEVLVEFLLNVDNSFGVHAAAFRFVPSDGSPPSEYLNQSATENLAMLRSIYENQLPPRVANAISFVNSTLADQKQGAR